MPLILTRHKGQGIELYVKPDTDPDTLSKLMAKGFTVFTSDIKRNNRRARIEITAPDEIDKTRCEISRPDAG